VDLGGAADGVGAGCDVASVRDRQPGPEQQLVGLRRQRGRAHVHRRRLVGAARAHQLVGLAGELVSALEPEQAAQLADRLMVALEAAEEEGGDVRGRQSAALLVVAPEGESWQTRVDLRVEDHEEPVEELWRLLRLARAYELAGEADELLASNRTEEAGGLYLRAAELAPESDELLFWAGLAQVHAGDVQAGMAAVRRAIELHPGWFTLLERLSPDFAPAGERVRRELASS